MRPPAPPKKAPENGHGQRRQHARLDLRMSAEIRTARSVFTATTRDLSEGGAGLDAERPLEEGEEVALGLFLVLDDVETDTPPLWVKARVAWARDFKVQELAKGLAQALLENSPASLRATKALLSRNINAELDVQIEAAITENAAIRQTPDFKEGIGSFLEKRKPKWTGKQ